MTTVISFIVVLGILIFIHELGHFAVAKYCGVGVEKFSLGFGPKLVGVRFGETEYRISLLPLGGYVKMVGEQAGEDVPEADIKRSFHHKKVSSRVAIVAAGPIMNLILAAFLLPVIFIIGIKAPAYLDKPVVVGYVAPNEAAAKAGMLAADAITAVDGKTVKNWEEFLSTVDINPGRRIKFDVVRSGVSQSIEIVPDAAEKTGAGIAGLYPPMPPLIGEVTKGYPAKEAGIKPGDLILTINGAAVTHWAELEGIIHTSGDAKLIVVKRGSEVLNFTVTPRKNTEMNVFLIGISRKEVTSIRRLGFIDATKKGLSTAVDMTGKLFVVIKGLVVGKHSLKALGGPLMIAQVAGKAAESGVSDVLSLMAFLSLQLGIINLFPIPVLDGGHILFFGIESVKGSPLSERFMSVAQQIGIALLIALMLLVTYNDLFRIFG